MNIGLNKKNKVTIRFFAILKDLAGMDTFEIELKNPQTCAQVLLNLPERFANIAEILKCCLLAINGSFVEPASLLAEGDELAVLPPVSGG